MAEPNARTSHAEQAHDHLRAAQRHLLEIIRMSATAGCYAKTMALAARVVADTEELLSESQGSKVLLGIERTFREVSKPPKPELRHVAVNEIGNEDEG